jgi:hypothetical protein
MRNSIDLPITGKNRTLNFERTAPVTYIGHERKRL